MAKNCYVAEAYAACRFGLSRSAQLLYVGPVSAWIGDHFRILAPNQAPRSSQPRCPSMGRHSEYPAKAEGVNRHITRYTSPYPWSCSVGWCLTEDWCTEISTDAQEAEELILEACLQIHVYFTYFTQTKILASTSVCLRP